MISAILIYLPFWTWSKYAALGSSSKRVVIEYNGMWKVSDFEALSLPQGWEIEQKLTAVDASTFQMYLKT